MQGICLTTMGFRSSPNGHSASLIHVLTPYALGLVSSLATGLHHSGNVVVRGGPAWVKIGFRYL